MTISASTVKTLRERSGAGMMDCKKALSETNGDIEAAVDWLRKKGLAAAAKKSGRAAAEGLVGVKTDNTVGVVVEVNSETDFVARNENFQKFVETVCDLALDKGDTLDKLKSVSYPGSAHTVETELTNLIAVIGENLGLRRVQKISVNQGIVAHYVHSTTINALGRIGVLVALESSANQDALQALGKQIAMHIAAANPQVCTMEELDPALVERERAILKEQALAQGESGEIVDKMVEGRVRKFYTENVLLEQIFMIDSSKRTVKNVILDAAKELGSDIKLKGFVQFRLGEGVEKKEEDFAAEVAAQLK